MGKSLEHTPGPWKIDPIALNFIRIIAEHHDIAFIQADESRTGGAFEYLSIEARANAHLISAAPELLDALKHIIEWCVAGVPDTLYSYAQRAIDKAEGRGGKP